MSKRAKLPPLVRPGVAPVYLWDGPIPGTHEPGFHEEPIKEHDLPPSIRKLHDSMGSRQVHYFEMGYCRIILALEVGRWHMTISHPDRHPSWDEIKTARYRICGPDLTMAMITPPVESYINLPAQDHVFHLWQLIEEAEGW